MKRSGFVRRFFLQTVYGVLYPILVVRPSHFRDRGPITEDYESGDYAVRPEGPRHWEEFLLNMDTQLWGDFKSEYAATGAPRPTTQELKWLLTHGFKHKALEEYVRLKEAKHPDAPVFKTDTPYGKLHKGSAFGDSSCRIPGSEGQLEDCLLGEKRRLVDPGNPMTREDGLLFDALLHGRRRHFFKWSESGIFDRNLHREHWDRLQMINYYGSPYHSTAAYRWDQLSPADWLEWDSDDFRYSSAIAGSSDPGGSSQIPGFLSVLHPKARPVAGFKWLTPYRPLDSGLVFGELIQHRDSAAWRWSPGEVAADRRHCWVSEFFTKSRFPQTYDPVEFKLRFFEQLPAIPPLFIEAVSRAIGPVTEIDDRWIERATRLDYLLFKWERGFLREKVDVVSDSVRAGSIRRTLMTLPSVGARDLEYNARLPLSMQAPEAIFDAYSKKAIFTATTPEYLKKYYRARRNYEWFVVPTEWLIGAISNFYLGLLDKIGIHLNLRKAKPWSRASVTAGGCSMDSMGLEPCIPGSVVWFNLHEYLLFDPIAQQRLSHARLLNIFGSLCHEFPDVFFVLNHVSTVFYPRYAASGQIILLSSWLLWVAFLLFLPQERLALFHASLFSEILGLAFASLLSVVAATYLDPWGQTLALLVVVLVIVDFAVFLTTVWLVRIKTRAR